MNEWTVVSVIAVLIGLISAVIAPVLKLNSIIAKLSTIVNELCKTVDGLTDKNAEAHDRIWSKVNEHDDTLHNHETRLCLIESKKDNQ